MSTPRIMMNAFREFSELCRKKFSDEDYERYCRLRDDFVYRKIGFDALDERIDDFIWLHDDLWDQFIILGEKLRAYESKRKVDTFSSATGSDDHGHALPTAGKDEEVSPRNCDQDGNKDKKHDSASSILHDFQELGELCRKKISDEDYKRYCRLLDNFVYSKIGSETFYDEVEDLILDHNDLWDQFVTLKLRVCAYAPKGKVDFSSSATGSDDQGHALPTADDAKPEKDQEGGNEDKKQDSASRTLYDLGDLFNKDGYDHTIPAKAYSDFFRRVQEQVQDVDIYHRLLVSLIFCEMHGDIARTDKEVSEILMDYPELYFELSYHLCEIKILIELYGGIAPVRIEK